MANNSINIGGLDGPILLFGGVYSNLQALQALWATAKSLNIPARRMLCTGDIVGYCAQPDECIQFMAERGIRSIAGNVELQLRSGEADCGCSFDEGSCCDVFSRQWYPFAQSRLSESSLAWIAGLPDYLDFELGGHSYKLIHGSQAAVAEFVFASSPAAVFEREFAATETDHLIAGHCGLPFVRSLNDRHWINPGVIGMPANDGTPRVWYGVLSKAGYASHALGYDHLTAARLMRERQLPASYADTLSTGIWDNCEILPVPETAAQGVHIKTAHINI